MARTRLKLVDERFVFIIFNVNYRLFAQEWRRDLMSDSQQRLKDLVS